MLTNMPAYYRIFGAAAASALLSACMQQPPDDTPAPTPPAASATPPAVAAAASAQADDAALAAHMKTPEFRREYRTKQEQLQNESAAQESAAWLGTTGLTDAQERNLPRYVRMELGQSLKDSNAVQAQDLDYVGHFAEPDGTVYYWRIPDRANAHGDTHTGPAYAYIRKDSNGVFYTDWGNRTPPLR